MHIGSGFSQVSKEDVGISITIFLAPCTQNRRRMQCSDNGRETFGLLDFSM
jgi:hypothetical protein